MAREIVETGNGGYHPTDLLLPEKIGIVGYGIVGQALANGFNITSKGRDRILFYDKYKESDSLESVVDRSNLIFLCLPTPMRIDELGTHLSIIEENVGQIAELAKGTDKIVTIKSTIKPGTTEKFERQYPNVLFAFNPEFLTEAHALEDFLKADRTIIGANIDLTSRRLSMFYQSRFPNTPIYLTDPKTAEMVKLAANVHLMWKVLISNQIFDICQASGINYDEMMSMVTVDKRIGPSHTKVTSARGAGGKCLPKDEVALEGYGRELGVDVSFLQAGREYNKRIRKIHDWIDIPGAVEGNHHLYKKHTG